MTDEERRGQQEMNTWQDIKRRLKKYTYLDAYQLGVKDERARSARLFRWLHEVVPALERSGECVSLVADLRNAIAEHEASLD